MRLIEDKAACNTGKDGSLGRDAPSGGEGEEQRAILMRMQMVSSGPVAWGRVTQLGDAVKTLTMAARTAMPHGVSFGAVVAVHDAARSALVVGPRQDCQLKSRILPSCGFALRNSFAFLHLSLSCLPRLEPHRRQHSMR